MHQHVSIVIPKTELQISGANRCVNNNLDDNRRSVDIVCQQFLSHCPSKAQATPAPFGADARTRHPCRRREPSFEKMCLIQIQWNMGISHTLRIFRAKSTCCFLGRSQFPMWECSHLLSSSAYTRVSLANGPKPCTQACNHRKWLVSKVSLTLSN